MYHVRNRLLHPTIGRWMQTEPKAYVDGMSLYQYVASSPIHYADSHGLLASAPTTAPAPEPTLEKGCCILSERIGFLSWFTTAINVTHDPTKQTLTEACKCWEGSGLTWSKKVKRVEANPCNCGVRVLRASTIWRPGATILDLGGHISDDIGHIWIESPLGNYGWAGPHGIKAVGWKRPRDLEAKVRRFNPLGSGRLDYGSKKSCADATCADIGECMLAAAKWWDANKHWVAPKEVNVPDPSLLGTTCSDFADYVLDSCCLMRAKWEPIGK